MVLLLKHDDVIASITMEDAIEAVEAGFREQAEEGLIQPPRLNLRAGEPGKGFLRIMPCVMEKSRWMGFKAMNLAQGHGVRYQVHLYSMDDGALRAIMDAQFLTTMRTGATSAVATRRLARSEPESVAVLGSGQEAWMQLEAMRSLGLVRAAKVYSPTAENCERLARQFRESRGLDVRAVGSEREAVEGAGLVVAAVNSSAPVLSGDWLTPGTHVNSVGTARPTQREIDFEVFRRADVLCVDTREGVFNEAGDAILAAREGAARPEEACELFELVAGTAPGRTSDDQITLFKSIGSAVQDISLAVRVYENAQANGRGAVIDGFPIVLDKLPDKIYY